MKISVITPVLNGEAHIEQTIRSVMDQKGDFELEYLIFDGGSDDRTISIVEGLIEEYEDLHNKGKMKGLKITLYREKDHGMYDAIAKGIKRSTGDILCYINSDDFFLPNSFQCITTVFTSFSQIMWLTGFPIRYNEKGELIRVQIPFLYHRKLIQTGFHGTLLPFIQQESVFFRRSLASHLDHKRLSEFKLAGDHYLWHHFAKQGYDLYILESLLSGNRIRSGQLSENKTKYLEEFRKISDPAGIQDELRAILIRMVDKLAGQSLKRRLSKHRVYYKNRNWVLKP
ncbi:MAG: glycosyltransferase [Flavobacteriales bacterium]|nr:glycosyltransferase [Flavobacteriales bacterium]